MEEAKYIDKIYSPELESNDLYKSNALHIYNS
jgi:hypothetical protein